MPLPSESNLACVTLKSEVIRNVSAYLSDDRMPKPRRTEGIETGMRTPNVKTKTDILIVL